MINTTNPLDVAKTAGPFELSAASLFPQYILNVCRLLLPATKLIRTQISAVSLFPEPADQRSI